MMQGFSRRTRHAVRRARRRRDHGLNIVSMIDILTVLVFFLLVNSTGVSILKVNLPTPSDTQQKPPPHALSVIVNDAGLSVADNGEILKKFPNQGSQYDIKALGDFMAQVKSRLPDQHRVTLLLAPNVPYDALVHIMDAVRAHITSDGSREIKLFPDVAVGDAPAVSATTPSVATAGGSS
jgi:Biopolymer transport protein